MTLWMKEQAEKEVETVSGLGARVEGGWVVLGATSMKAWWSRAIVCIETAVMTQLTWSAVDLLVFHA